MGLGSLPSGGIKAAGNLLDGPLNLLDELGNFLSNPFAKNPNTSLRGDDFPDGFEIEELERDGKAILESTRLRGHLMPEVPFEFGGEQRIIQEHYPGNSEPVVHILGPTEDDITIRGRLWDKKFSDFTLYGTSEAIQIQLQEYRIRGNLLRLKMGNFQRYAHMKDARFRMKTRGDIRYEITFTIVGFNPPLREQFAGQALEIPFKSNAELNALLDSFNTTSVPPEVPASIADILNDAISVVAGAVSSVTDLVDNIVGGVEDIQNSINRAVGVVTNAQTTILQTRRRIGRIRMGPGSTISSLPISSRYITIGSVKQQNFFYTDFASILDKLREQFAAIAATTPIARHLVQSGDTLQKLALKFYDDDGEWKKIYDHNKLTTTELVSGSVLEIPRQT